MIIKEVTQKVLIKDGIKILDCDVVKLIEDEVAKDDSYNSFKEVIYRTLKSNCSISLLKLEERCTYTSFFYVES